MFNFTAQIFDNFISFKWLSNRSFNNTFWNNTCLVTLLALRRDLLSDTGGWFTFKFALMNLSIFMIRLCYVVHLHSKAQSSWCAWPSIVIRALCIHKNIINIQAKRYGKISKFYSIPFSSISSHTWNFNVASHLEWEKNNISSFICLTKRM